MNIRKYMINLPTFIQFTIVSILTFSFIWVLILLLQPTSTPTLLTYSTPPNYHLSNRFQTTKQLNQQQREQFQQYQSSYPLPRLHLTGQYDPTLQRYITTDQLQPINNINNINLNNKNQQFPLPIQHHDKSSFTPQSIQHDEDITKPPKTPGIWTAFHTRALNNITNDMVPDLLTEIQQNPLSITDGATKYLITISNATLNQFHVSTTNETIEIGLMGLGLNLAANVKHKGTLLKFVAEVDLTLIDLSIRASLELKAISGLMGFSVKQLNVTATDIKVHLKHKLGKFLNIFLRNVKGIGIQSIHDALYNGLSNLGLDATTGMPLICDLQQFNGAIDLSLIGDIQYHDLSPESTLPSSNTTIMSKDNEYTYDPTNLTTIATIISKNKIHQNQANRQNKLVKNDDDEHDQAIIVGFNGETIDIKTRRPLSNVQRNNITIPLDKSGDINDLFTVAIDDFIFNSYYDAWYNRGWHTQQIELWNEYHELMADYEQQQLLQQQLLQQKQQNSTSNQQQESIINTKLIDDDQSSHRIQSLPSFSGPLRYHFLHSYLSNPNEQHEQFQPSQFNTTQSNQQQSHSQSTSSQSSPFQTNGIVVHTFSLPITNILQYYCHSQQQLQNNSHCSQSNQDSPQSFPQQRYQFDTNFNYNSNTDDEFIHTLLTTHPQLITHLLKLNNNNYQPNQHQPNLSLSESFLLVEVSITERPSLTFTNGLASIINHSEQRFVVHNPSSVIPFQLLFTIATQTITILTMSVQFDPISETFVLVPFLQNLESNFQCTYSLVGPIALDLLNLVLESITTTILLPLLNQQLFKGIDLPSPPLFTLIHPTLTIPQSNILLVKAGLQYKPIY